MQRRLATTALILAPALCAQEVEFIGLEQWTPDRVREALGGARYCAANLIHDLGMADACVMYHMDGGETRIVVSVVEPQHSARVRYLAAPNGQSPLVPAWRELSEAVADQGLAPQVALLHYGEFVASGREAALAAVGSRVESAQVESIWQILAGFRKDADFDRAVWALGRDPNARSRACAAAILMNFGARDLAWWSLVRGLRDDAAAVRSACSQALLSLTRARPRTVDWAPATDSLRALLGGTNLFAFYHLLDMLVTTGVSPDLASALLADNDSMVLGYLGAQHDQERQRAHAFLVAMRGEDLGGAPEDWRAWLDALPEA